jgi:threonine dehydrogenase-like Zn-dependent dehydrogenase
MGLAAINYVLHREDRKPSLLIVTDIDQTRLDRAAGLYTVTFAASRGIDLRYINTSKFTNVIEELKTISGGEGFNDIFVFAPVAPVIEQADALLAFDGCLNFFAGPSDPNFKATLNFYNVHYAYTHIVGTSGGNTEDMKEALKLMSAGLDPAGLVTHIGGINAVIEATLHLPEIPGGKKLIYNHIEMALTPITEFAQKGLTNPVYARLAEICDQYQGLWSTEAEAYLLANTGEL